MNINIIMIVIIGNCAVGHTVIVTQPMNEPMNERMRRGKKDANNIFENVSINLRKILRLSKWCVCVCDLNIVSKP